MTSYYSLWQQRNFWLHVCVMINNILRLSISSRQMDGSIKEFTFTNDDNRLHDVFDMFRQFETRSTIVKCTTNTIQSKLASVEILMNRWYSELFKFFFKHNRNSHKSKSVSFMPSRRTIKRKIYYIENLMKVIINVSNSFLFNLLKQ